MLPPLILQKGAERRIRAGHLWVYSNEVDVRRTPLTAFVPGQQAQLQAANGKPLGTLFVNPHALICGRLISRDSAQGMTPVLLARRLAQALALRARLFPKPYYRLVFGDSDGLPGLVVDRFGDTLVVQISSAGMEGLRDALVEALETLLQPVCIVFKNDGKMRQVEGLPEYVEAVSGEVPECVVLEENGVRFEAPLRHGQKTGWFFDHRLSRQRLQAYAPGLRVLDVFSYLGGWGLQAAAAGAQSVVCVDSSAQALDGVMHNAALNGLSGVSSLQGDAFEVLRQLCDDKARFDIVVLDPPALIPRRRDIAVGEAAYARLNELGLRLLDRDGLLVSASCSMHLQRDRLLDIVRASGRKIDRFVQVLEQGHQAPDHPIVPAIPETDYIKALFVRSLTDLG